MSSLIEHEMQFLGQRADGFIPRNGNGFNRTDSKLLGLELDNN